jgi:uncharacterized membrane protein
MRRIVLTFGLIAGAILAASMLLALPFRDQIGFDRAVFIGYTTMVVAFLMIYFGVRQYRDTVAGGTVSFGRAFSVGLLITLVATVCYVATWEFIYFKVTPQYGQAYAEHALEKARRAGASEGELARQREELAKFQAEYDKLLVNIAYTFLEPMPVGVVFALVSAGILRRRKVPVSPLPA